MTNTRTLLPYAAIFLLALGLRLYSIGAQSLWYDEGLTVALVQRSPADIVRAAAADIHPPLYYLLLKAWASAFGTSEWAVRSLSALCGAAAAVLTATLGRRWFGEAAGVIAGVGAAVSPLGVYYGQEARMYALTSLLAVLLWLALDLWRRNGARRWLILYALAALAGLLTHYFFVTLVAAAGVAGLVVSRADEHFAASLTARLASFLSSCFRGARLAWVAVHIALAAVYLPLVWGSRGAIGGWTATQGTPGPALVLLDSLRAMALGPVASLDTMQWLPLFAALLLAVALWPAPLRPVERRMAVAWLLVPIVALALLSLGRPYYKPRFLLPTLPAFHLLLGAGAVALAARVSARRPAGANARGVFVPLLLLAAAQPLLHTYFDPRARRDDYRAVASFISATARPDDAVLLTAPGQSEPLGYYLKSPLARYPLPRTRPLDPAETERELEALARDHRRVYGVFYVPEAADPQRVIVGWLDRNAFRASSQWYSGVELAVYELGGLDAPATPLDADFGGLRLLDARAGPLELHPGDAVRADLRWRADAQLGPLLVFAHLLDDRGALVAQFDGSPSPEATETWAVGQEQRGRLAVLVPPDAAPGVYHLVLGVYELDGARRTLPGGGDALTLAEVRVIAP